MYDRLGELVGEALTPSISWQCKLGLLDRMSDVLASMIEASSPHPPLTGSPTSGYRLTEHAYKALLKVPREIRRVMPLCDQVP